MNEDVWDITGQINATKGHGEGRQSEGRGRRRGQIEQLKGWGRLEVREAVIKSKWGNSGPLRRQRDTDCERE